MQYGKKRILGYLFIGFILTACSTTEPMHQNDYIYQGINFGADRNVDFQKGVQDACKTADGDYTKDREKFKNNESYRIGWEDGRLQCKGK